MRTLFATLAALLASAMIVSCEGGKPDAKELRLVDLARYAREHDGDRVTTTGVVRSYPKPLHYWIEDSQLNRVEVYPEAAVSSRVGEPVRVVGRFHYSPAKGRSIEVDEVTDIKN